MPEVHVSGMCIQPQAKGFRILIAKRSARRWFYPKKWEGCGGPLADSESFIQGVVRHFHSEMAIEVRVLADLHVFYEIQEPNRPLIPGIRFVCEKISTRAPNSADHSEIQWVTPAELKKIPPEEFIPGLQEDFLRLAEMYQQAKKK